MENFLRKLHFSILLALNFLPAVAAQAKPFNVGVVATAGANYPAENIYVDLDAIGQFNGLRLSRNINTLIPVSSLLQDKTTIKKLWGVPVVRAQVASDFSVHTGGKMQMYIRDDVWGLDWIEESVELKPCSTCGANSPWAVYHDGDVVTKFTIEFNGKPLPQSVSWSK